jgi:hypothetical protein
VSTAWDKPPIQCGRGIRIDGLLVPCRKPKYHDEDKARLLVVHASRDHRWTERNGGTLLK